MADQYHEIELKKVKVGDEFFHWGVWYRKGGLLWFGRRAVQEGVNCWDDKDVIDNLDVIVVQCYNGKHPIWILDSHIVCIQYPYTKDDTLVY